MTYYKSGDPYGKINGLDTEWTIAQRKAGNAPEAPKEEKEYTPTMKEVDSFVKQHIVETMDVDELKDKLEDTQDEEERMFLEQRKQRRLLEMREKAMRTRFGKVAEIVQDEYIREVTNADPNIFVVCHLYSANYASKKLDIALDALAYKHINVKFVRIKGCLAIQNFPDKLCPTLLIYKGGKKLQFGRCQVGAEKITGEENKGNITLEISKSEKPVEDYGNTQGGFNFKFQMK